MPNTGTKAPQPHPNTATGSLRFDSQAKAYDRRAGLPPGTATQVVQRVHQICLRHCASDTSESSRNTAANGFRADLLEIAAGTGELGVELAQHFNYVALEGSVPMLEQFQQRLGQRAPAPRLIHADANRPWPVAPASQHMVFIARAAHLIEASHLAHELRRCARPGGLLVLGRVTKDSQSIAARMRQKLQALLREHGYQPQRGGQVAQCLARLLGHGSRTVTAARWTITESPAEVLQQWRNKPGLGGVMMSADEQSTMLAQLQDQATQEFSDLQQTQQGTREYQLTLIPIHA